MRFLLLTAALSFAPVSSQAADVGPACRAAIQAAMAAPGVAETFTRLNIEPGTNLDSPECKLVGSKGMSLKEDYLVIFSKRPRPANEPTTGHESHINILVLVNVDGDERTASLIYPKARSNSPQTPAAVTPK